MTAAARVLTLLAALAAASSLDQAGDAARRRARLGRDGRAILTARPLVVQRGTVVTFAGRGFLPNAIVRLAIGPPRAQADVFGSTRTNARGAFTKRIRIARNAKPGLGVIPRSGPGVVV